LSVIDINSPHWYQTEDEFSSDRVTVERIQEAKASGQKPVILASKATPVRIGMSVPPYDCEFTVGRHCSMRLSSSFGILALQKIIGQKRRTSISARRSEVI